LEPLRAASRLRADELLELWPILGAEERVEGFLRLDPNEAEDFFLGLTPRSHAIVLEGLPEGQRRLWIRLLPPDDVADLLQEVPPERHERLLGLLDEATRRETVALLAYKEDVAGGLMSPRFARLRPEMTIDEAIAYLRRQAREQLETINYAYVLDGDQRLQGVVSFRDLFSGPGDRSVRDVMEREVVTVDEGLDQEAVSRIMAREDVIALPVVDRTGRMKGIVTVDDIVDVVQEEATEDIQKLGGMEALDRPYLQTSVPAMLKKRAGWLAILFLGEMLTASVMGRFEDQIARAVVLALFVPLIISSGGNSGSQAATLVIRAMALGEVALRDWWRIVRRELFAGLALGGILGTIGVARVLLWQALFGLYGDHALGVAITVGLALVGVVTWGTLVGSMLPFVIRRIGFDPASASAPFVATLVDVSGIVIYFSLARAFLGPALL
jgi:magnesium transporter